MGSRMEELLRMLRQDLQTEDAAEDPRDPAREQLTEDAPGWVLREGGRVVKVEGGDERILFIAEDADQIPALPETSNSYMIRQNGSFRYRFRRDYESVEEFRLAPGNRSFSLFDGVLYTRDLGCLALFPPSRSAEGLRFPPQLRRIGKTAFLGCLRLGEVILPEGVKQICPSAFATAWGLTAVSLPDSVTQICPAAFSDCEKLERVRLPQALSQIEDECFFNCKKLAQIQAPRTLRTIGMRAFQFCWALTDFAFPEGLKEIGEEAFAGSGLKEAVLPRSLWRLGTDALRCHEMERAVVPASLGESWVDALILEPGKIRFDPPEQGPRWEGAALLSRDGLRMLRFDPSAGLERYELPGSVREVVRGAFRSPGKLRELRIPEGVTTLRDGAIGLSTIGKVYLPRSLQRIERRAIRYANDYGTVYLYPTDVAKEWLRESGFRTYIFRHDGEPGENLPPLAPPIGYDSFTAQCLGSPAWKKVERDTLAVYGRGDMRKLELIEYVDTGRGYDDEHYSPWHYPYGAGGGGREIGPFGSMVVCEGIERFCLVSKEPGLTALYLARTVEELDCGELRWTCPNLELVAIDGMETRLENAEDRPGRIFAVRESSAAHRALLAAGLQCFRLLP